MFPLEVCGPGDFPRNGITQNPWFGVVVAGGIAIIFDLSRFGVILVLNKIVNFNTQKLGKINSNRRTETGLGSPRGQARQISLGSR